MLKILIADDHTLLRRGLIKILSDNYKEISYTEAGNAVEIFEAIKLKKFDIVLLDISMPGRNGLDIIKELKLRYSKLPILVISMYPEDQFAVRVLKAGASGYLSKDSAPENLITAIEKILVGKKYISTKVADILVVELDKDSHKTPLESLSDRELQVMLMIASGKTVSEIAENLSLSVKTISTYRSHILKKLGLKNNAEIMHYVINNNIVI